MDVLVLTGDIFDGRGIQSEAEFRTLVREFFEEIGPKKPIPFLYIPGNHEGDFRGFWNVNVNGDSDLPKSNGGELLEKIIIQESAKCSGVRHVFHLQDSRYVDDAAANDGPNVMGD